MEIRSFPACRNISKTLIAASFLTALLFSPLIAPVQAKTAAATITVKAVVLPFAAVKPLSTPATLTITEADISRGYVDASSPSLVEIRTNSPRGCVLALDTGVSPFREAEVTLQGRTVVVGPQGGMIALQNFGRQVIAMSYRFLLAHDARPGTYPWPFSLSVSPLQ